MHLETSLGHVCNLSRHTPALQYAGGLVLAVVHAFGLHATYVVHIVAIAALNEYAQIQTFIGECVGQTESEVRVRIADISTV